MDSGNVRKFGEYMDSFHTWELLFDRVSMLFRNGGAKHLFQSLNSKVQHHPLIPPHLFDKTNGRIIVGPHCRETLHVAM